MNLNRGQILDTALVLAGRTDKKNDARTWLNLFLEDQYKNQDWSWLIKTSANLAVTQGMEFPADYLRAKSAVLIQGTSEFPIEIVGADEFDDIKRSNNFSGTPAVCYLDESTDLAYFYPAPNGSFSLRLRYYHEPDYVDPSVGADSQDVFWKGPKDILVQGAFVYCLKFLDDARFPSENALLDSMIGKALLNSPDKRAGSNKLPLGKSFQNRFGTRRRIF